VTSVPAASAQGAPSGETHAESDLALLERAESANRSLREAIAARVVGQDDVVELMLVALLARGHALLVGVPGLAKTLLVSSLAEALGLGFGRVQFTPDLLPADITGTDVLHEEDGPDGQVKRRVRFLAGPIFHNLILADEINRTPPKTQAALLQAMNERIVTIDGTDHALGDEFMVIATQNPIEQQGTYPLPEAQLDRFLFKLVIDYPDQAQEREIVRRHGHRSAMPLLADFGLQPVVAAAALSEVRTAVSTVTLADTLIDYIVDIIRATRQHASLQFGASPRAANMLAAAVRALAALQGRDFVIPDDIKTLAVPVLRHRIVLSPGAEIEGVAADRVVRSILDQTPVPR